VKPKDDNTEEGTTKGREVNIGVHKKQHDGDTVENISTYREVDIEKT